VTGEDLLLRDRFGRVIRDLRISITDRCNLQCRYCLPERIAFTPREGILRYEEILRLVRLTAGLGVRKVRVTGGEPLLRRDVTGLLQQIHAVAGLDEVALTTNGLLLARLAPALRAAGVARLNVSLDSLRRDRFADLTGVDALPRVLDGIEAASAAGFYPLKINCVVIRGRNDDEVGDFADFARRTGHRVRFIEFMPLDSAQAWDRSRVVGLPEIVGRLAARYPLVAVPRSHASETAQRYTFADNPAEIGIIAPITTPFCGQCDRLRITADGHVRNCLFATSEPDLLGPLRSGAPDEALVAVLRCIVADKQPGHRINAPDFAPPARSMSRIGG